MLDRFNRLYTKIKSQLIMESEEEAAAVTDHEKQLKDKIQAWFPDEDVDELLDILSEPDFRAPGLPSKAYKKMDELVASGVDPSDVFYEVYDGWDEDALKAYLENHVEQLHNIKNIY